jgi:DNA modification methylase
MVKLADLKPDRNNARKHNPRNIGMVANSLREVGAARSGVIDEDGNILAGNGTYEALSEAGIEKVKIIQADGNEWVVVQRKGLSEKQKLKLALYDNRSAELAEWDKDVLADIDPEIMESMFSTDELEDLLDNAGSGELEGEDDVPEAPEKAISQLGDLYQLGQHRLLCGDSTAKEAVDKLMDGKKANMIHTDPPYNVSYGSTKNPKHKIRTIENDSMNTGSWEVFCKSLYARFQENCEGDIYMWGASGPEGMRMRLWLVEHGCNWSTTIIWKKQQLVLSPAKYQRLYEPCFYGWFGKSSFKADRKQVEVWEVDRPHDSKLHPTMKPIELCEVPIRNSSNTGDRVLDLFGGSGSTLIASEKLNRKCYMMELDTKYCDVIVKRFNDLFPDIEILRNGEAFEPIHD